MRKKNIRSHLILNTSAIVLGFITLSSLSFYIFLIYFSQTIEKVYGIDDDILKPFFTIFIIILIFLIIFSLIVSILAGFLVSERFLSTIAKFTNKIKSIRYKSSDKRLPLENSNELDDLAKEFNYLMDDIEISVNKQNQFVADASHELKTPLAIIKGNIEMLQRWGKDEKKILEESLETTKLEVDRMILLTSEMLQLTKKFDHSDVSVISINEIITSVVNEYIKLYPDFNIEYSVTKDSKVKMKQEHFKQILFILLDNSIKYKRDNSKHIKITFKNNFLHILDYGKGIEKENLNKIFDRLYREDDSRENNHHSFGLGLSILKRICDWYKVEIKVNSEKNQYTEFILNFKGGKENEEIFN
ncbi:MAG: sensor histidine kinase [Anaerorhabdus sp.]